MKTSRTLFALGAILMLAGSILAWAIHGPGGVEVEDVRFVGDDGQMRSGLLYLPPGASAEDPAPAILAVHGYINSREVQSGFAIEFARRGYVVFAVDQTGHGYSEGAAFSNGFGGPAALAYLRSLPMVDTDNIGLEGHSMGGWTILAAAAAYPDGYKAMVLEGSSTGAPFAREGTPDWPRNVAVVFSAYDEFSQLMWGVEQADNAEQSPKLQTLFGTDEVVEEGRVYGDIAEGTARMLAQPPVTHPGDHISRAAIGEAVAWFGQTLEGGSDLPAENQIWYWKELGTTVALIGFALFLTGTAGLLLQAPYIDRLRDLPTSAAHWHRGGTWWAIFAATALIPVATFYPVFWLADSFVPDNPALPQLVTNQIALWALVNGVIAALIGLVLKGRPMSFNIDIGPSLVLAAATVLVGYVAVAFIDWLFLVDPRFWFVGIKLLDPLKAGYALIYAIPLTVFFLLALRALHAGLSVEDEGAGAYVLNALALAGGFALFLAVNYAVLFTTGSTLTPGAWALETIVMFQFVPVLVFAACLSTFLYRRTASYVPGALLNALFVSWFIVGGQVSQVYIG